VSSSGGPASPSLSWATRSVETCQGLGYATEAALAAVLEAERVGIARVWATIRPTNVAPKHSQPPERESSHGQSPIGTVSACNDSWCVALSPSWLTFSNDLRRSWTRRCRPRTNPEPW
jgi:hypothetical protein